MLNTQVQVTKIVCWQKNYEKYTSELTTIYKDERTTQESLRQSNKRSTVHLNVSTELPDNVGYRPDVLLQQLAGLHLRLPGASGGAQTGDDVILDAERVVDETASCALLLGQSILKLRYYNIPWRQGGRIIVPNRRQRRQTVAAWLPRHPNN
jgi:hypothetical protein